MVIRGANWRGQNEECGEEWTRAVVKGDDVYRNKSRKKECFHFGLTPELTRRRPELVVDNKPDPGGRVE